MPIDLGMTNRGGACFGPRAVRGLGIIGGDVMEVAPQYDNTTNTAQVGAQMLFEILCLVVLSPAFQKQPAR